MIYQTGYVLMNAGINNHQKTNTHTHTHTHTHTRTQRFLDSQLKKNQVRQFTIATSSSITSVLLMQIFITCRINKIKQSRTFRTKKKAGYSMIVFTVNNAIMVPQISAVI